jgi:Na+-transporting methylmalonyl-CoA/oxaloacetate decarboxylase gamma subunit
MMKKVMHVSFVFALLATLVVATYCLGMQMQEMAKWV